MKIVSVLGSPRKNSNSSAIAERFCATARGLGAEIRTFTLNDLEYRGCQACMACKTKLEWCVLEDELTEVLEAVREADVLLLASPVYYGDVSSQLKSFIDRTYSYFVPDFHTNPNPCRLAPGKKLVFVLTQGHPDESKFADIFSKYDYFFRERYSFVESHLIRVCGVRDPGEIESRPDALISAEKIAGILCGNAP